MTKQYIVTGNKGGSISLKSWQDTLVKLSKSGIDVSGFPKYLMDRCRFFHVNGSEIKFGEFDPNCNNVITLREFCKNYNF